MQCGESDQIPVGPPAYNDAKDSLKVKYRRTGQHMHVHNHEKEKSRPVFTNRDFPALVRTSDVRYFVWLDMPGAGAPQFITARRSRFWPGDIACGSERSNVRNVR